MVNQPKTCPACGTLGTGRFCAQCGAALDRLSLRPREHGAWRVAAAASVLVLGLLVVLVWRDKASAEPGSAGATVDAAASPPDLSSMSPRERFDRLYQRVMGAAQTGDTVTVERFAPMVFAAYDQLDTVDADARYHAALLHLHLQNDTAAAFRLADTILGTNPRHLFGFLIEGTAAQLAGDLPRLARARKALLAAWDAEQRAARPEYRDHQKMLDQFRAAALASER
jgi:hypothetical protein